MDLYFHQICINLDFEKPIIHKIKNLKLKPKINNNYLNLAYLNYYYEEEYNNEIIKFNTLFKDEYLVILIDIYNVELKTSIFEKNIILIKLEWELKKFKNDLYLWEIINYKNKEYKYFYLPFRLDLEENTDMYIPDIIMISQSINYKVIMNTKKKIKNKNLFSLLF